MPSLIETLTKRWELCERGICTKNEFAGLFWDEVGHYKLEVVGVFRTLPKQFQTAIAEYIRNTDPNDLPPCQGLDGSDDIWRRETELRNANFAEMAKYLASHH